MYIYTNNIKDEIMEIFIYIITFILGIIIGSFLNVCIIRLPASKSIVTDPSSCPSCGTRLKPIDLIPVFSYLFLRGKCRHCKARISAFYPFIEALTGVLFILLYMAFGLSYSLIVNMAFVSILIVISFIDLKHMIIPNGLIVSILAIGVIQLIVSIFTNVFGNPIDYAIGFFAGGIPLLLIAVLCTYMLKKDAMGGGDIKLMAAAGLVLGWKLVITSYLIGIVVGAVIGVILLAVKKKKRGDEIPFGPFLAFGILTSIFFGNTLINWYLGLL